MVGYGLMEPTNFKTGDWTKLVEKLHIAFLSFFPRTRKKLNEIKFLKSWKSLSDICAEIRYYYLYLGKKGKRDKIAGKEEFLLGEKTIIFFIQTIRSSEIKSEIKTGRKDWGHVYRCCPTVVIVITSRYHFHFWNRTVGAGMYKDGMHGMTRHDNENNDDEMIVTVEHNDSTPTIGPSLLVSSCWLGWYFGGSGEGKTKRKWKCQRREETGLALCSWNMYVNLMDH